MKPRYCLLALLMVGATLLPSALATEFAEYSLDLGERTESFDCPPAVSAGKQIWIAFDALTRIDSYSEIASEGDEASKRAPSAPQASGDSESEQKTDMVAEGEQGGAASPSSDEAVEAGAEPMANEAVELKLVRPSQVPRRHLPLSFTLGGKRYRLRRHESGKVWLTHADGDKLGREAMVQACRIYLHENTLRAAGIRLSYAPASSNFRLLGSLVSLRYDAGKEMLVFSTLLPTRAYAEPGSEGAFRVVLASGFVAEPEERQMDPDGNTRVAIRNLPGDRLELRFFQKEPTGFKLYAEPQASCFFKLHFANHFNLVEYRETSSGEIAVDIGFSRPTDVKPSFLSGPPRLVLDFPGTIYDEATKRISVGIGRVREIRVGQFQSEPPTVRVVVEMKQRLNYRVLKEGGGERYFIQFYRGGLRGGTVLLDAGHGGSDTGAIGVSGTYEKSIAIAIANSAAAKLKRMGYRVYLTRSTDRFVSLGERADYANRLLPAIFVSIHANWLEDPEFSGVMAFHFAGSLPGQTLAAMIQRHLVSTSGAVDKGVRTADFFVLRETVVPAVLIETGFISNAAEELRLRDPSYQSRVAQGIAEGIDEYFRMMGGFF